MPIVPRVNPESVTNLVALPGVRNETQVRPVSGIAEVGNAFAGLARKKYQEESDKADVASYMEAQRKLSDWQNTWNDPNNAQGVHSYKGRDALKLHDAILPDFDKTASEIAGALPSPRAREKFAQYAAQQRDQTWDQSNRYAVAQNEAYIAGERKVYEETQVNDLIRAQLADPDQYAQKWATTLDTIYADTAANGASPKVAEARIRAMQSGVHAGVMDNLLASGKALAGREYFHEHADQFNEEDKTRVLRALQPLVEDEEAEEAADAAEGGHTFVEFQPPARGKPAGNVKGIIEDAAKAHGVPTEYLLALAEQESGFNPKARNKEALDDGDHAEGLFQYRRSTSAALGNFDRSDPVASANAAAREFRSRMDKHGPDFAIAAHFAGDGGAEAVVKRGQSAKNPKTARYLDEVRGRASRWRGESVPVMGATRTEATQGSVRLGKPMLADALERVQALPLHLRGKAEAKVRDRFAVRNLREQEFDRQENESINLAIWEAPDPSQSLAQILGPERYAAAARKGDLGRLASELAFRREGDPTRIDVKPVVGEYLATLRSNPAAFAQMDVMKNARHMSPGTAKELLKIQADVREGKFDSADYASENEQLNALVYTPLKIGSGKEEDKAKRAPFEAAWFSAKRDHVKRTGKQPSADERETIIKRLATSFALHDVPLGDYKAAGIATKVPADAEAGIRASFAKRGIANPTIEQIRKTYLIGVGQ